MHSPSMKAKEKKSTLPWKVKREERKHYRVYWILSAAIKLMILAGLIIFLVRFYNVVK